MKKRAILAALWAGLVCVSLCSCRGAEDAGERESLVSEAQTGETEEASHDEEALQTPEPENAGQSEEDPQTPEPEDDRQSEEEALSYSRLGRFSFSFSSGVGAWGTDLEVYADGSFKEVYHDSDMGVTGEGYPNGTVYLCGFSGNAVFMVDARFWLFRVQILSHQL